MSTEELRAASDKMLTMLERLGGIEHAKQQLPAGSPEFVVLAEQAEHLARVALRWSELQLRLAREQQAALDKGDAEPVRLTDVRPRQLDRILADWREAEIRLETATPGSPEAELAAVQVTRFRDEYHAAERDRRGR